jgi:hypothetical protein
MNAMNVLCEEMKQASDRAESIREFREEIIGRRQGPRLKVIAARTIVQDGRIITQYLIDSSSTLGRGSTYWLSPATPPAVRISRMEAA